MRTTSRQSVTLTKSQLHALRKAADRLEISTSDLIRRIIDDWRTRPGTIDIGKKVKPDIAKDEIKRLRQWTRITGWEAAFKEEEEFVLTPTTTMEFILRKSDAGQNDLISACGKVDNYAFRVHLTDGRFGYFVAIVKAAYNTGLHLYVEIIVNSRFFRD